MAYASQVSIGVKMVPCPKCESLCTVPILYGKPSEELMRAAARGLVELGGCSVDIGVPTSRCLECGNGWQRAPALDPSALVSDAIVFAQKHRGLMSHLTFAYGSACIAYGRSLESDDEEARSAYAQMLSAFQEIERAWEQFFDLAENWRRRNTSEAA